MRPVLCMITDRRRAGSEEALVAQVAAAARAGIHLVQVRERDLEGGPLLALVEQCLAAVRGTTTRVLVNERLDVALAAGAHGVHLRGDSVAATRVRAMVPQGFVIGRSVHDQDDTRRAVRDGADYLLFGTVFETASKPGRMGSGVRALAAVAGMTSIPVLAVGGVVPERAGEIARAGASGVAAIGMFMDAAPSRLAAIVDSLATAFDSAATAPRQ